LKLIKRGLKFGISEENIVKTFAAKGIEETAAKELIEKAKEKHNIWSRDRLNPEAELLKNMEAPLEQKKKSISESIDDLNDKLDTIVNSKLKKKEDKQFQLPFGQRSALKNLAKQNKVLVFYLTENRAIKTIVTKPINNFITIDGVPHNFSMDFVFLYKGKYPAIILPAWDLDPIGTRDLYDANAEGRRASPAATIIRMMVTAQELTKPHIGGMMWIWLGIGAVVILYLIFGKFS
jgi:hypothetical protein